MDAECADIGCAQGCSNTLWGIAKQDIKPQELHKESGQPYIAMIEARSETSHNLQHVTHATLTCPGVCLHAIGMLKLKLACRPKLHSCSLIHCAKSLVTVRLSMPDAAVPSQLLTESGEGAVCRRWWRGRRR